jgi:hypothetical protein
MGRLARANAAGDKAASLGYRLQREHPWWGTFWLWSRDQTFPIAVTREIEAVEYFLDQPRDLRDAMEEHCRVEWQRHLQGLVQ